MISLTQDDARRRSARITVGSYAVTLDLTQGEHYFGSVTKIRFATLAGSRGSIFVDVAAHRVDSARLDGRELDLGSCLRERRLTLEDLAPGAGEHELVVDAVMTYSRDGEGLHRHVDPADGRVYLYAMSFLDAAPRWFACVDQPDLKAPVSLDVRCPADWTVAGNGPATELGPGHWHVAATRPLATYFTTLVAGPYHRVESEHDGIRLVLHARRSLAEHLDREAPEILAHTRHGFDELHRLFGVRYPWGEYHQAFVPEFNAGAMENPGCVTLRDSLVFRSRATDAERADRAVTIAHEMAHMWFGDLVTMRWWDDLWLNESFAEYLGHRALGEHTWAAFGIERKSWGYRADRRPSTHPVAGNGAADAAAALAAFDGISYAKGASLLRQLSAYLGDDAFLAGLRRHITAHAFGNAGFADLLAAWAAEGHDLRDWADAWLRTSGVDTLAVEGDELVRTSAGGVARPHTVVVAALGADGGELDRRRVTITSGRTAHGLTAGVLVPDADDETWARIALPDWSVLTDLLPRVASARTRVALWNALVLAVADAEADPLLAVDVVAAALPVEPDDAVVTVVGRWAAGVLTGAYLGGAARDPALDTLCAALLAGVRAAPAGSGRQLALARAGVAVQRDGGLLEAWLSGADVPDGLVIDAELRWTMLRRCAELGVLDETRIAAEAAADATSQGAVHAAWCRAARPDAAAKAAAWEAITADAQRPNYELYALAGGLWRPGQQAVTDPYVPRFFDALPALQQLRTGWVLTRLVEAAYPWPAVRPGTLAAAERALARPDLAAGVRRALVDAADDQRRALAARTRFAGAEPE